MKGYRYSISNKIERTKELTSSHVRLRPALLIVIYLKLESNLKMKDVRSP